MKHQGVMVKAIDKKGKENEWGNVLYNGMGFELFCSLIKLKISATPHS